MKRLSFLSLLCMAVLSACNNSVEHAQQNTDPALLPTTLVHNGRSAETPDLNDMPTMDFEDTIKDFGTIQEGEVLENKFVFKNNGHAPLIISDAKPACGCTAADYPREPVLPGETGSITVKFNSLGRPGVQNKDIAISTNSNKGLHILRFKANVESKKS
jgi:hypothetical protein